MFPIIVLGTGRCGTSFASGILHNDFNICMGKQFVMANEFNPDGYYESSPLNKTFGLFVRGRLNLQDFLATTYNVVAPHGDRFGFKVCASGLQVVGLLMVMFPEARFIYCVRDHDAVIRSHVRKLHYLHTNGKCDPMLRSEDSVSPWVSVVSGMLDRFVTHVDHLKIDFTERVSKEFVIDEIRNKWGDI